MTSLRHAALAAAVTMFVLAPAAGEPVGNASAIVPAASQQPPQGTVSDLRLKDPVIRNAELATAERGALEITFLDASRLSMGANSRLTVDEFVYGGPGGAGKQTIRYTKGLFRFLSGSIPKDQVKIETPTVTIGIRGTIIRTLVNGDGSGQFAVEYGPNGEMFEAYLTDKKTGETLTIQSGQLVEFGGGGGFSGVVDGTIEDCP